MERERRNRNQSDASGMDPRWRLTPYVNKSSTVTMHPPEPRTSLRLDQMEPSPPLLHESVDLILLHDAISLHSACFFFFFRLTLTTCANSQRRVHMQRDTHGDGVEPGVLHRSHRQGHHDQHYRGKRPG